MSTAAITRVKLTIAWSILLQNVHILTHQHTFLGFKKLEMADGRGRRLHGVIAYSTQSKPLTPTPRKTEDLS